MKKLLKKTTPNFVFEAYYYSLALLSSKFYSNPSEKMIVIGVVGTKGKTSTINFIWSVLMAGGQKTGIVSTANIRIGSQEFLNDYHMTMPGRFVIQKLMADMVKEGCKFCIVETTSEGIKQHRNIGINYDILVFTNLFPEHLPSHGGSFEKYKETKGKVFASLMDLRKKNIDGREVDKIIVANKDSEHADYFLQFDADKKITYALNGQPEVASLEVNYKAENIQDSISGVSFNVNNEAYNINILGKFNVYNALPAIVIAQNFNINNSEIKKGLENLEVIPGRMEIIYQGQNFTVIVDYAHEKESMTNLLQTANSIKKEGKKVIVVLGAEGGGRDKAKRPQMGKVCGELADYVIVANVDPYDDDPKIILEDIALASENAGKIRNQNLFIIEDRKSAIAKALSLAGAEDIVLITGKGAEQSMIIGSQTIPWDDRKVVKEGITTLLEKNKNDILNSK